MNGGLNFRAVHPSDVSVVRTLLDEFATFEGASSKLDDNALNEVLFSSNRLLRAFVAEKEGAVVGLIAFYLTFSSWTARPGVFIQDLYVKPAHRGDKVGTGLLRKLAQHCIANDFARIDWWVLDWNEKALEFYQHLEPTTLTGWVMQRLEGDQISDLARRRDDSPQSK